MTEYEKDSWVPYWLVIGCMGQEVTTCIFLAKVKIQITGMQPIFTTGVYVYTDVGKRLKANILFIDHNPKVLHE